MSEKKIFNLQVELNDVCNLECRHCYQYRSKDKEELDIVMVLEQCAELGVTAGFDKFLFRLSGGEVTLRKDLFKVIRAIRAKGYYVEVITNGVLVDLPYAFALKTAGTMLTQVSLDGSTAEKHDFIRGKGSFDKTIKGIGNFIKAGLPVEIKFTLINGVNTDDIENMLELCKNLGVGYISLARFIYEGNGILHLKDGNLLNQALKQIFYKIITAGKSYPELNIHIRDQLAKIINDIEIPKNVIIDQDTYIGKNYLAIDTYGNVYADRQLNIVLNNLHKKTLAEIWQKNRKLKELKGGLKYLRGKCITCELREICLGGNKTAAYALTGSPFEPDPGCWM